jgi:hypothetical protein
MDDIQSQLLRLVSNAVQRKLIDLHTALPGVIETYYPAKGCADISIAIKRKISETETSEKVEVLPQVPVVIARTSEGGFHIPLKKGDQVLLIFCERSLDDFKLAGGIVEPASRARFFDYADAVAIPGLWHQPESLAYFTGNKKDTSMFIHHAGGFLGIDSDGKTYIGKTNGTISEPLVLGNVLKTFLSDFMDKITTLLDDMKAGPIGIGNLGSPVPIHPVFSAKIDILKAGINSLKSSGLTTASTNIVSQTAYTARGGL